MGISEEATACIIHLVCNGQSAISVGHAVKEINLFSTMKFIMFCFWSSVYCSSFFFSGLVLSYGSVRLYAWWTWVFCIPRFCSGHKTHSRARECIKSIISVLIYSILCTAWLCILYLKLQWPEKKTDSDCFMAWSRGIPAAETACWKHNYKLLEEDIKYGHIFQIS